MPGEFMNSTSVKAVLVLAAIVPGLSIGTGAVQAAPQGDWPCIQRKVPKLSAGAYWTGPAIDENAAWRNDPEVAQLVGALASRRTPMERAEKLIGDFAKAHEKDKQEKLTLVFAGVFNEINNVRSDVMRGIERFVKNQDAKTDALTKAREEFEALAAKPDKTQEDLNKLAELQATVQWLVRIYDDRQSTLTYICETPVLLEQRLYAVAKAIQAQIG